MTLVLVNSPYQQSGGILNYQVAVDTDTGRQYLVTLDVSGSISATVRELASIGEHLTILAEGEATLTAEGASLTGGVATPCRYVWLGAPVSAAGAAANSHVAFAGIDGQVRRPILWTNFDGIIIPIADAADLFVKGEADEKLEYQIIGGE